jgi:hypothetical protein
MNQEVEGKPNDEECSTDPVAAAAMEENNTTT